MTKPDSEKHSESGVGAHSEISILYGASCMQGWRVSMEDSHSAIPLLGQEAALFAVYDGHGGKEVALYCRERLPGLLKASPAYAEGDAGSALKQVFMDLDVEVSTEGGLQEMRRLMKRDEAESGRAAPLAADSSSDDEDYQPTEEEALMLKQEAQIPLDEITAQFSDTSAVGRITKSRLSEIFSKDWDTESSEGSGEDQSESASQSSEEREVPPSPSPSGSQGSPSSSQPSAANETDLSLPSSKDKRAPLPIDTSSNLDVPSPHQPSLPSPIHTPNKLPLAHLLDSPSQQDQELEEALKEEQLEVDRTPLLPDPASSSEDESAADPSAQGADKPYMLFRKGEREGFESGSTAVVCVIRDGNVVVANAGDSRCVLCRKGEAYPLSFDHKPTDEEELRRITRAGGVVGCDGRVNAGLNLSRSIGDHKYKRNRELQLEEQMITALPDVMSTRLEEGDSFLVLACDGIWNVMDNQEVVSFIQHRLDQVDLEKEGPSALARISEELCDGCLADRTDNDGSGCDNMTVIIVVPQYTHPQTESNQIKVEIPVASSSKTEELESDRLDNHPPQISENGSRQNGINRKRKGSRISDNSKRVKSSVDL